jgi:hypothetical protein
MRLRLSRDEAEYLKDQLDMWIEGYQDIDPDDHIDPDVVVKMLSHREMAERIRGRIWKHGRRYTS